MRDSKIDCAAHAPGWILDAMWFGVILLAIFGPLVMIGMLL